MTELSGHNRRHCWSIKDGDDFQTSHSDLPTARQNTERRFIIILKVNFETQEERHCLLPFPPSVERILEALPF